jgi:hypothetical protein
LVDRDLMNEVIEREDADKVYLTKQVEKRP